MPKPKSTLNIPRSFLRAFVVVDVDARGRSNVMAANLVRLY
jgi:hypothetical protein